VRIIAGSAGGRPLRSPRGEEVRPTTDRVREALFNALTPFLPDARFLDLFAGSGANGVEALSRGAREAVFVERDPRAVRAIRDNLRSAGFPARGRVVAAEAFEAIERLTGEGRTFGVIFADPPYAFDAYEALLAAVEPLAEPEARVIAEHAAKAETPSRSGRLERVRTRRYGASALTWYQTGTSSCS
jgi:16S rRNA (guanine(966)-N(2))-methyltransferase RsmD